MIKALSATIDMVDNSVHKHHKRVSAITNNIARQLNILGDDLKNLLIAAALHDIGALSGDEENNFTSSNLDEEVDVHAEIGYLLLKDLELLRKPAEIIRYHHHSWDKLKLMKNKPLTKEGHILHLSDNIEHLINPNTNILTQKDTIRNIINEMRGEMYSEEVVDAFLSVSQNEFFWLDIDQSDINWVMEKTFTDKSQILSSDQLLEFAQIFANIIDFRSPFTATHSSGVAAVASELARLTDFTENDSKSLMIAGYLHDLGKIIVPSEILEKDDKLTPAEFSIMRGHSFYTYSVLKNIMGLEEIADWAALHHEKLDGSGYPFGLIGSEISKGSRLMAISDIFTAIAEDRPYRQGMSEEETMKVLESMIDNKKYDTGLVRLLMENYSSINRIRIKAQQNAYNRYSSLREKILENKKLSSIANENTVRISV